MKNWKKFVALLTAVLLVMAFAACTPAEDPTEEPTQKPTQAPTEAPTETPTEAPTEERTETPTEYDDSVYMGQWYSGSVTLIVKEEKKWVMQEKGETFIAGSFLFDESGNLIMYDVEGMEVARMLPEEDGTLYAEMYVEEMYNRVDDFFFTREPSGDTGEVVDEGDSGDALDG